MNCLTSGFSLGTPAASSLASYVSGAIRPSITWESVLVCTFLKRGKKARVKKDWPGLSSQWLLHDTSLLGRSPRRAATGKGKPMTPIFTINSSTNLKISLKCKYVLWNISPTAGADQVLSVWSQQIQSSAKLEFLILWWFNIYNFNVASFIQSRVKSCWTWVVLATVSMRRRNVSRFLSQFASPYLKS